MAERTSCLTIEAPQQSRHLLILLLDLIQRRLDERQALRTVGFVNGARLILHGSEMLNLFAAVLDLRESQGCRRPFEEMAEGGELGEITSCSGEV